MVMFSRLSASCPSDEADGDDVNLHVTWTWLYISITSSSAHQVELLLTISLRILESGSVPNFRHER
jgi:hypothetical protein